jgi:elongation factor Ts
MAEVSAAMVKRLRDETGAGMMDCKRALAESAGDVERAKDWLRAKGLSRAAEKAGRATNEGIVHAYVHSSGGIAKIGALVELDCESDFVAKTDDFKHLAHTIAQHVVGASPSPQYVRREEVPADAIEREKAVYREQAKGKPESVVAKILEGKLNDYFSKVCLLEQPWIRDDKKKVSDLVTEAVASLKENITIARFSRFAVGEGGASGDGASASPQ